jgi:F-type H+-transporting ATPase subunit delta
VRTPAALPEGAKVALTDALGRYFGKKVVAAFVVDESLYGGVVARVGNLVLDSSLKGRLDRIRQRIQGMTA